jgi:hypothetical protein
MTAESPDYEASLNFVFANTQEEESIYPLTIMEIAETQTEDTDLKALAKADKYEKQLVEDTLDISVLQRLQASYSQTSTETRSRMVPPLPAASCVYPTGRNFERFHALERYAVDS